MTTEEVLVHVEPPVVVVHVTEGHEGDWTLAEVKATALLHPGAYRLALSVGRHTLALGAQWNVDSSLGCAAALERFGRVEVIDKLGPTPLGPRSRSA